MRMYDIIEKKKQGGALSKEEIAFFVKGYTNGEIPDYQASALCMAICLKGMNDEETAELTFAIRDSGKKPDFSGIKSLRADKHSTGGVGDKTSLVICPIVASLGVTVAKMSGRGLGHTGGTVDKLEAIPGFRTDLDTETFCAIAEKTGLVIAGQSAELAPADKKLYALRDVTATVDSLPLIASSIMSKKLAADDDCIVLDVKTGSGAFMKSKEESEQLARVMVQIGKRAGKKMSALVTDMDVPLGNAIGNALEVREALEVLKGQGPEDLKELCFALSGEILVLAQKARDRAEGIVLAKEAVRSGKALEKFKEMVRAQGGDASVSEEPEKLAVSSLKHPVCAPEDGFISAVDAAGYGKAALLLGAGRNCKEDAIDLGAGILLIKKTGDAVKRGEPIAELYGARKEQLFAAEKQLLESTVFSAKAPPKRELILAHLT